VVLTKSFYKLNKGTQAPDFSLPGTDEKMHSLGKIKGEKATLIIFMCNHCPYVQTKLSELNRITEDFKSRGLQVIGINSNDSEDYSEDNFENMKAFVNKGIVKFLYLHDESQEVAKSYGAVCTPDPFLFDKDLKLVFHSRIDDPPGMEAARMNELYEAIKELLNKGIISLQENPSLGCSIKWKA